MDFRKLKSLKLGPGNLMRSSELKNLIKAHNLCGDLSAGLEVQKVLGNVGTKLLMYSVPQGNPLFFQVPKQQQLWLTLYGAWAGFQPQLPIVEISSSSFESLKRGSDLFAPGVLGVVGGPVLHNDQVLLCVEDSKIVGVGRALQALDGLESGSASRG